MIACLQHRRQRARDRSHAGGSGKGVFRALDRGDAFLEHGNGRVSVAGIDEFIRTGLNKTCLGLFGAVIDKALREKYRL